jgi:DNA invertase Pin-like site-specific DNA recombinase
VLTGTLAGAYTPTGEGKFFFTIMAAFAELERDMIHQRTMAGLEAARRQGRIGGRPTVVDADKTAAAHARRACGESPTQIAKALGISRATYYRHLAPELAPDGPRMRSTGAPWGGYALEVSLVAQDPVQALPAAATRPHRR